MKPKFWVGILLLAGLMLISCAKKDDTEQNETAAVITVKAVAVQPQTFSKSIAYNATVSGIRETKAGAAMGGKIAKIFCKVGDHVQQDQVVMEFPDDTIGGRYLEARAAYTLADSTYNRMKKLYEIGGISRQDLDQAKAQRDMAYSGWDTVQQMHKVRAPLTGEIVSMNVQPTDNVDAEDLLFTVADLSRMKAKLYVPEKEIGSFHKGIEAVATWNGKEFPGTVTQVGFAMDPEHQAFLVEVEFANPGKELKSGVRPEIGVQVYHKAETLVVPRKATRTDSKGMYVMVVKGGAAQKQYIEPGMENGIDIEVVSGLVTGDQVVVEGLNKIKENDSVEIVQ